MTMRSATKRSLFVGVTVAFIIAVIIFQFNGRRMRARKRHVAGPRDQMYQRQRGFVAIPRNLVKGPPYRADQPRGFGAKLDRVRQDRMGDNAGSRGQLAWRGDGAARTKPRMPAAGKRDWWKENALRKYPVKQAPLGRGASTSLPVKAPIDVGQFSESRNNSRRGQQSSIGKTTQFSDNTQRQFHGKEGQRRRPGNNLGVDKAAGSRAGDGGAVKRQNGSRMYDGRQRMKPSSGSPSITGREGVRRQGETWTKKAVKVVAPMLTRSTTRSPDGARPQGQQRGIQRPDVRQGERYVGGQGQHPVGERRGATGGYKAFDQGVRQGFKQTASQKGGMGPFRRISGDKEETLKSGGDKQVPDNIQGDIRSPKQIIGQIGSQKIRHNTLVQKISNTDRRNDKPVSDQKRKWPKYTNV